MNILVPHIDKTTSAKMISQMDVILPSGHWTLGQYRNLVENRLLHCPKLNYGVIPTSSVCWVGIPDRVNIPCLMHDTCQLDVKMTNE